MWESREDTIDLGTDPLALRGLPMRFSRVAFTRPGQYEFELVCDGAELASVYIEARE